MRSASTPHTHSKMNMPSPNIESAMPIWPGPVANVETNIAAIKAPLRLRIKVAAMIGAYPVVLLQLGERHALARGQAPGQRREVGPGGRRHVRIVTTDRDRQVAESASRRVGGVERPGDRIPGAVVRRQHHLYPCVRSTLPDQVARNVARWEPAGPGDREHHVRVVLADT